jgi:hypothetical protein
MAESGRSQDVNPYSACGFPAPEAGVAIDSVKHLRRRYRRGSCGHDNAFAPVG